MDSVQFTSATDHAIAESKEATHRVRKHCDASRDERRWAQLDMRQHLQDPGPTFVTPSPPTVDLKATLANMPFASEEEISLLNEALAASLASRLVNTKFPSNPITLHDALSSPDASSWPAGIEEELKGLLDMGVYKLVPCSSVSAGHKVLRGIWVFHLKRDENGNPV